MDVVILVILRVEERVAERKKLNLFPSLLKISIDSNISPSQVHTL